VTPLVDLVDYWYMGEIKTERAASMGELKQALVTAGVDGSNIDIHHDITTAMTKAMADAGTHDRLIVFGSFYTVAEIMQHPDIADMTN